MSLPAARVQKTQTVIPHRKLEGHTDWVMNVIHLRGRIITCSLDGSLRVWNMKTGKQTGEDWREGETRMSTIALSPDGKNVLSGSTDGAVRLWDIDTAKVIAKYTEHTTIVTSLCWSRDGRRVVSGEWRIRWNSTGVGRGDLKDYPWIEVRRSVGSCLLARRNDDSLLPQQSLMQTLAWPGDGKTLISGSREGEIRIWNTTSLAADRGFDGTHRHCLWHCDFSELSHPRKCSAVVEPQERPAHQFVPPAYHPSDVNCLSFSADGKVLATGCSDNNAYI